MDTLRPEGDKRSSPRDLAQAMYPFPTTFAPITFLLDRDRLGRVLNARRVQAAGGATAAVDSLRALEELRDEGWADLEYSMGSDDRTVASLRATVITPQCQQFPRLPGVTQVLQHDTTRGVCQFDVEFGVVMGTDPASLLELPLAFTFTIKPKDAAPGIVRANCTGTSRT